MNDYFEAWTTFSNIKYSEWISRLKKWPLDGDSFPEIFDLENAQQHHTYHQEGNALIHTFMVIDEMGKILDAEKIYDERRKILLLAALCHDFGKVPSTFWHKEKCKWVAYGHEISGVPIAAKFLERIGIKVNSYEYSAILKLVRWHMLHTQKSFSVKFIRKLKQELFPAKLEDLIVLMTADCRGKIPRTELPESIITLQGLWALEKDA